MTLPVGMHVLLAQDQYPSTLADKKGHCNGTVALTMQNCALSTTDQPVHCRELPGHATGLQSWASAAAGVTALLSSSTTTKQRQQQQRLMMITSSQTTHCDSTSSSQLLQLQLLVQRSSHIEQHH
jgi:hypothetical protein